jgi:hypothetical protein
MGGGLDDWYRFCCFHSIKSARRYEPSFRDGPKDQTRNLKIPGSMLRIAPE